MTSTSYTILCAEPVDMAEQPDRTPTEPTREPPNKCLWEEGPGAGNGEQDIDVEPVAVEENEHSEYCGLVLTTWKPNCSTL